MNYIGKEIVRKKFDHANRTTNEAAHFNEDLVVNIENFVKPMIEFEAMPLYTSCRLRRNRVRVKYTCSM
jgi:hypothetical protein